MSYSASGRRDIGASVAHCRPYARLLCALALTIGLVHSAPKAHAQAAKASAVAAAVSQSTTLEGTLEVRIEDYPDHTSKTHHYLTTAEGKRYELQFSGKTPPHLTGSKVRVHGTKSGTNMLALDSTSTTSMQLTAPPAGLSTFGEQKVVVLLLNFQDQPTNKPWTLAQWNSLVFTNVNGFYQENSFQQAFLSGNVYGWFTLPINSTDACNPDNISAAADQLATAAGIDMSAYPRHVYAFPASSCTWAGLSTVGGNPSRSFINNQLDLRVVGHELGHAFGLDHSHSNNCDTVLSGNCSYQEYGDSVDIMGGRPAHFNAFQKERLGWLNYSASPAITTVSTSGAYSLATYETAGSTAKALKILKSINPTTGAKTWYYIEARKAVGYDALIATDYYLAPGNIPNGVLVHTGTDGDLGSSYLLDMTPGSLSGINTDFNDAALQVGASYTDSSAGFTITPTWADSTGVGVTVSFASAPCTRVNPSVLMSSGQSASVLAGTAVAYTVAVTNNDSSGCSASTFSLQGTVPTGWSGTWAASSLTVSAGSAASTTFTATSSSSALAGTYSIAGKATNSTATTYSGSGPASYVIGTSSTTTTVKGKGRSK